MALPGLLTWLQERAPVLYARSCIGQLAGTVSSKVVPACR